MFSPPFIPNYIRERARTESEKVCKYFGGAIGRILKTARKFMAA